MQEAFSGYHPVVNFIYFFFVIFFGMLFMHPVCLGISLLGALSYAIYLNPQKMLRFSYRYLLPILLITALVNPAFNHEGATILFYLENGNPVTLESILYGIAAATMLITIFAWFSCYNHVMTSDKFIYLFGRIIPALSLILSMVLRFVPRFKDQLHVVSNAQKCIGRDVSNGKLFTRIRHGIRILSIMITWSLENAIETADSMRSRGYGLKGRTAFSIFRFDHRDKILLGVILFFILYILVGAWQDGIAFRYFPTMQGATDQIYSISIYLAYLIFCFIPLIINLWEDRKWKLLQSKI